MVPMIGASSLGLAIVSVPSVFAVMGLAGVIFRLIGLQGGGTV